MPRRAIIYIFLIFLIASLPFLPIIFDEKTYFPTEYFYNAYPWKTCLNEQVDYEHFSNMESLRIEWGNYWFYSQSLKEGNIPLWNPYIYCGVPFLASALPGVLDPLNLFFLVLPVNVASAVISFIGLFLGGLLVFFLLQSYKISFFSSFVGAISFQLSSLFLLNLTNRYVITTLIYTPLILLLIEQLWSRASQIVINIRTIKWLCTISLVYGLQLLSGNIEIVMYSSLLVGVYLIFLIWRRKQNQSIDKVICFIIAIAISLIVGILIALPQLWPTLELSQFSNRVAMTPGMIARFIPPYHLITTLIPNFFGSNSYSDFYSPGTSYGTNLYLGPVVLFLCLIAFYKVKNTINRFFCVTAIVALIWAMSGPIYSYIFSYIPYLNKIESPDRMLVIFFFSIAVITGFGSDYVESKINNLYASCDLKNSIKEINYIGISLLLLLTVITISIPILNMVLNKVKNYELLNFISEYRMQWLLEHFSISNKDLYIPIILGFLTILLLITIYRVISPRQFKILLIILLIVNAFYFHVEANSLRRNDALFPLTDGISFLQKDKTIYRMTALSNKKLTEFYVPNSAYFSNILETNLNIPYGIQDIRGHLSLYPKRIHDYGAYVIGQNPNGDWQRLLIENNNFNRKLLDMANVKYIILSPDDKLEGNDFKLVYSGEDMHVYENLRVLPRTYIVHNWKVVSDIKDQFQSILDQSFDPSKTVIIEKEPQLEDLAAQSNNSHNEKIDIAEITKYNANSVYVRATLSKPGLLILSDTYDQNWKVYIDCSKIPTNIYVANHSFRAVPLKEGAHDVEFRYIPYSFHVGIVVSILTILVIAILLFIFLVVEKRNSLVV